jgi:hypothetical protein
MTDRADLTLPIVFSDHALMRYQRRIHRDPTDVEMGAVVTNGSIRSRPPGLIFEAETGADCYLVSGEAVFPLKRTNDKTLIALTCLRARRMAKADRRALREYARDQRWEDAG